MKRRIMCLMIVSILLTGCNKKESSVDSKFPKKEIKVNSTKEDIEDYQTEEQDFLTFLDFENSYAMCKAFTLDYYNNKNLGEDRDISIYFENTSLYEYTTLLIEIEPKFKIKNIDFGLSKLEVEDRYIYLELVMRVGNKESSYSETIEFLIVNRQGKLKIADWIVGTDMHGNYNSYELRELETLTDIYLWDDSSYADKMLNKLR